ncbi:diaminopimelate epimerase [Brackiella oedipodis]|uniref:diaminopimelate epimerase n=1 Tax=Brackiella oedipodis TaxID=124225 RepID=UPI00048C7365|nr:diaminopimelate epimerase [Brackiella oedipodis]
MEWTFTKMQGAGNDFVVLDGVSQAIDMTPTIAAAIADRHFGIGCDQILLVENPSHPEAHFRYRIFNADGSEVEHCGNGARCFVRFVHQQRLSARNPLLAEICTGLIELREYEDQTVAVAMGQVSFESIQAGFENSGLAQRQQDQETLWQLPVEGKQDLEFAVLSISNPHAVLAVPDNEQADVAGIGAFLESHERFTNRVNVGFMQIKNPHEINLRVYERGVGETLACGTGACAAVVSGIRRGLLRSPVKVHTHGGDLSISWESGRLYLRGPACTVFSGSVKIDELISNNPNLKGK